MLFLAYSYLTCNCTRKGHAMLYYLFTINWQIVAIVVALLMIVVGGIGLLVLGVRKRRR